MTFEASRKKQVLVLQPRGKALYEDEDSFGSKMLAKMGWNKGKGLGKEQHGTVDFIQIRYKNNSNGLGFNGLKDDQWTENESQFDNLLKSLNNSNANSASNSSDDQPTAKKSLEEKSKLSRARVHYKKFTKGKDVHKYSEKDLANILGKKTLKEVVKTVEVEEEKNDVAEEKTNLYDSNLIINTGMSVTDYFKQKMQEKMNNLSGQEVVAQNFDEEKPKKNKKKRKNSEEPEVEDKKSKKKSKNKDKEEVEGIDELAAEEPPRKKKSKKEEVEEVATEVVEIPSKKKKSKKSEKIVEQVEVPEESDPVEKKKKKKSKSNQKTEELEAEVNQKILPTESKTKLPKKPAAGEPVPLRGANAVYSTNVIQIPSYVAKKMSSMSIHNFKNANVANIVGYGLSEDIEIKTLETKMGDNSNNTDKYSLYNMDRLTTSRNYNPRKIISKLKRTKKSIQVI